MTPEPDKMPESITILRSYYDDLLSTNVDLQEENAELLKQLKANDGWDDYSSIKLLQRENAALRTELQQILGLLSDMEIVTKTHLQALRDADLIKRIEDTIERVDAAEEAAKQSA